MILLGAVGIFGLVCFVLTIRRPAVGCMVLALGIPLTVGIGRHTLVPLLRPSEALLLVVGLGLLLHYLPRRRTVPISGLDLLVGTFAIGMVLIPSVVLYVTQADADLDRWRIVFGPLQFFMIYLVFSRTELSNRDLTVCLKLLLLASLVVGAVAMLQLTGALPSLVSALETYYPRTAVHWWDPVNRPTSLLGHFSAVGAFAVLNYSLALVLAATRHPGFKGWFLSLAMGVNVATVLASLTVAPAIALIPVTLVVIAYARWVPRQVVTVVAAGALALLLFSPVIFARLQQQQVGISGQSPLVLPQSLDFRIRLWNDFFIPELAKHVWVGTGTAVPSEVPISFHGNVDSEYLEAAYRAGVVGPVLLLSLLVGLGIAGWRCRTGAPWPRSLGGAILAYVVLIAIIGISAEYLTYGGVSQHIAMVVGLLAGLTRQPAPVRADAATVITHPRLRLQVT
jgi:hypothetical protein